MKIQSYKELIVWQKSIALVEEIYKLTSNFPAEERFGIITQIRRAAISIPSNIAEGYGRRSYKEYLQFYSIAYGSALELETQLIISQKLHFTVENKFTTVDQLLNEIIRMIYVMIHRQKGDNKRLVTISV